MSVPIMLSLLALVSGGIITFIWKVAGANQAYGPSYMIVETLAFGLVALIIHLVQKHPFDLSVKMTGIAALGGVVAAITVFSMILAFRLGGEGSILFPIAGLSVIVAVILSYIVYREPVTATKLLGLGLGVISIIFLTR